MERTATAAHVDAAEGAVGGVPLAVLRAGTALPCGKAAFKARLADAAVLDLHRLPVDQEVLALVGEARAEGRPVWLASASDKRWSFADPSLGWRRRPAPFPSTP